MHYNLFHCSLQIHVDDNVSFFLFSTGIQIIVNDMPSHDVSTWFQNSPDGSTIDEYRGIFLEKRNDTLEAKFFTGTITATINFHAILYYLDYRITVYYVGNTHCHNLAYGTLLFALINKFTVSLLDPRCSSLFQKLIDSLNFLILGFKFV